MSYRLRSGGKNDSEICAASETDASHGICDFAAAQQSLRYRFRARYATVQCPRRFGDRFDAGHPKTISIGFKCSSPNQILCTDIDSASLCRVQNRSLNLVRYQSAPSPLANRANVSIDNAGHFRHGSKLCDHNINRIPSCHGRTILRLHQNASALGLHCTRILKKPQDATCIYPIWCYVAKV